MMARSKAVKRVPLPLPSNLESDGRPKPEFIPDNLSRYGYSCPRQEYIESPVQPTLTAIARKWNIVRRPMDDWYMDQDWKGLRKRYWQRFGDIATSLSAEEIRDTRMAEVHNRLHNWTKVRDGLLATVERGGMDKQSATGSTKFIPFEPKDWDNAASALERIEKNIDNTLGLSRDVMPALKQVEESQSSIQRAKRFIKVNLTVTEESADTNGSSREIEGREERQLPEPTESFMPDFSAITVVGEMVEVRNSD